MGYRRICRMSLTAAGSSSTLHSLSLCWVMHRIEMRRVLSLRRRARGDTDKPEGSQVLDMFSDRVCTDAELSGNGGDAGPTVPGRAVGIALQYSVDE